MERNIFENITQDEIASSAKSSSGFGRLMQYRLTWRDIICSKSYGTHSQNLDVVVTSFARHLATDIIPHDHILSTLLV